LLENIFFGSADHTGRLGVLECKKYYSLNLAKNDQKYPSELLR
jgi:hypothetical protein